MTLNAISVDRDKYAMLLADFPLITIPQFSQVLTKHKIQHHIPTSETPNSSRARRLSPEKLTLAKQEFQKMLEMRITRRSSCPWASPRHLVPKSFKRMESLRKLSPSHQCCNAARSILHPSHTGFFSSFSRATNNLF